jgi:hypothetical protein
MSKAFVELREYLDNLARNDSRPACLNGLICECLLDIDSRLQEIERRHDHEDTIEMEASERE